MADLRKRARDLRRRVSLRPAAITTDGGEQVSDNHYCPLFA
ncbi:MAG: hypothetical protein WBZ29_08695 [Methanocella sp.]